MSIKAGHSKAGDAITQAIEQAPHHAPDACDNTLLVWIWRCRQCREYGVYGGADPGHGWRMFDETAALHAETCGGIGSFYEDVILEDVDHFEGAM